MQFPGLAACEIGRDSRGVYRVGGTRVTLDLVVRAFNRGATAEDIVQRFPSLELSDVYLVLGPSQRSKHYETRPQHPCNQLETVQSGGGESL